MNTTVINRLWRYINSYQQELEQEILSTPTSESRNDLTEANIHLLAALSKLTRAVANIPDLGIKGDNL